ncbi:uncharacterized protein IAS62_002601 [Cryptococcus decagattii]|uniref:F-box domain-containing protein n=1 Tax=Cryptococcus decagattii TaxID=1859122 RepID=A0ABZ2AS05_9TREE
MSSAAFTGVGINPPTPAPSPDSLTRPLGQLVYHSPPPRDIIYHSPPHTTNHPRTPLLRRDFLRELPWEVALHVLSFVDDPQTLARAAQVSKYWNTLLQDETTWRDFLLARHRIRFSVSHPDDHPQDPRSNQAACCIKRVTPFGLEKRILNLSSGLAGLPAPSLSTPYKTRVKLAYLTETNWLSAGVLLAKHLSADDSVVTTLSFDESWIVVGMANSKIHVFSAVNGAWKRSLEGRAGHTQGVWAMVLVSPMVNPVPHRETQAYTQDERDNQTGKPAEKDEHERDGGNLCGSVRGWQGLKTSLVVSGGCDKQVKVWNLETGQCIHSLPGHTSTIRCIKVLPHRPIAVSGSRDYTLRVWDIHHGTCLHTLRGHTKSVRCVEVWGNMAVSGSYDNTAKLWNLDTGECLQTFTGHYSQIYSIAFNGSLVITGSLDSTVRVWSPANGECLALLQGHTALVGQLQLSGTTLVTAGSDGRVILFDLSSMSCVHRLCAHDNSVTCLQFDKRFIVSGGNDGRVKLWDVKTGAFVRELTKPCDAVWRTSFRGERIVVLCQREGRTCLEVVSFRPGEGERRAKEK